MAEEIVITPGMYTQCVLLLAVEDLKKRGMVAGGPDIDEDAIRAIKTLGDKKGWPQPTDEDVVEFIRSADEP